PRPRHRATPHPLLSALSVHLPRTTTQKHQYQRYERPRALYEMAHASTPRCRNHRGAQETRRPRATTTPYNTCGIAESGDAAPLRTRRDPLARHHRLSYQHHHRTIRTTPLEPENRRRYTQ